MIYSRFPIPTITLLMLFFFLTNLTSVQSQSRGDTEWGEVSKEELRKTVYEIDSTANAILLFDKARIDFTSNFDFIIDRHVRVKLLDQEGFDHANINIGYWSDLDQQVSKIKARTYNIEDGKVTKTKMDDDAIFEENISDTYYETKFTLPNLKEGSVIEYQYRKILSNVHQIPNWEFQRDIPVLWSELDFTAPKMMQFVTFLQGNRSFYINNADTKNEIRHMTYNSNSSSYALSNRRTSGRFDMELTNYRWVMKDLPALKDVGYVKSIDNHRSKLWLQLKSVEVNPGQFEEQIGSWLTLVQGIREWTVFNKYLYKKTYFEDQLTEIVNEDHSDEENIETIFNFVQNAINWNGTLSIYTEESFDDILEKGEGTSAEINYTLIDMLNEAGFEAYPVIISTQNHGAVLDLFPIVDQFNTVIAAVKRGGNYLLMDARTNNLPYNLLPISDLNGAGLLIKEESHEWIPLNPPSDSKRTILGKINLDNEANLEGNISINSSGYLGLIDSKNNGEMGTKEYCESKLLETFQTSTIENVNKKSDFDTDHKFVLSADFSGEGPVQKIGDNIYLKPIINASFFQNPFLQPERDYPIYFDYPHKYQLLYHFQVPESYSIESLPKPVRYNLPNNMMSFTRVIQKQGNVISVLVSYSMNNTNYAAKGYPIIKEYMAKLDEFANEQIVLKKL